MNSNDIYNYLLNYLKYRVETDRGQTITISAKKLAKFYRVPPSKFTGFGGKPFKMILQDLGLLGMVRIWRIGKKQLFCFYKEDLKRWLDERLEGN